MATSREMTMENLATGAAQKGIQMIGCSDCLHPQWRSEVIGFEETAEGTYRVGDLDVVLTAEIEAAHKIHHLLIFPSASSVEGFIEIIGNRSSNISKDGRPNVKMNGVEIAQAAVDVDALFGPCHAFTPWTAIYRFHDSLADCYGSLSERVSFLELGLSANTDYADRISELQDVTFLTNSDAHSPVPLRLAREFNRFEMEEPTFAELRKVLHREGGRRSVLNVGMPPQEGKYNESACSRCFQHYELEAAVASSWRCSCRGRIKKGVVDRVNELATWPEPHHPDHRPPYLSLIPLAQIISLAIGVKSPTSKKVMTRWSALIDAFGDEVNVLVDLPIDEIAGAAEPRVVSAIRAFRDGRVILHPGGGGEYGRAELPEGPLSLKDF
jgi:uncharacterized protein (TIGR00375 family)